MTKYKTFIVVLCLSAGASNPLVAAGAELKPRVEQDLKNICIALKSDSKHKLYRAIKHSGISKKVIANKLVCNGMDALTFAMSHDADHSVNYLAKYRIKSRTELATR